MTLGSRPETPVCNSLHCEFAPLFVGHVRDPENAWFCPLCRRWVCWCTGCADEGPDICDDCWYSMQPEAWGLQERKAA